MDFNTLLIFMVCIGGAVYTSYRSGLKTGAEEMVSILEHLEFIVIDDDGNISTPRSK